MGAEGAGSPELPPLALPRAEHHPSPPLREHFSHFPQITGKAPSDPMQGPQRQAWLPHRDPWPVAPHRVPISCGETNPHLPPREGPVTFLPVRDRLMGQRVLRFGCYQVTDPPRERKGRTDRGSWSARCGGTGTGRHRPARYSHAQISQCFCGEDEGLVPLMGELEHAGGGQASAAGATQHRSQPRAPVQPPLRRSHPVPTQPRGLGFSLPSEMLRSSAPAQITPVA